MLSEDYRNVYLSEQFQPYVKLVDVLLEGVVVKEENVSQDESSHHYEPEKMQTIEIRVKEEVCSEHIEDVPSKVFNEDRLSNLSFPGKDQLQIKLEREDDNPGILSLEEPPNNKLITKASEGVDLALSSSYSFTGNNVFEEEEGLSNFDLHLSSDSDTNEAWTGFEDLDSIPARDLLNGSVENSFKESPPDLRSSSEKSNSTRTHNPESNINSQDVFEHQEASIQESSSSSKTTSSSHTSSVEDNQERQEEWNTQQLKEVSQRLRLRSRQAKRLIMKVIRKKQMEDETLESFKKRLRRM